MTAIQRARFAFALHLALWITSASSTSINDVTPGDETTVSVKIRRVESESRSLSLFNTTVVTTEDSDSEDFRTSTENIFESNEPKKISEIVEFPTYSNISKFLSLVGMISNVQCRNHTIMMFEGLSSAAPWAVQMFDSSVKTPVGMAVGSTYNFGNFDECTTVQGPGLNGKYCLVDFALRDPQSAKAHPSRNLNSHYVLNYKMDGHKYHDWRSTGGTRFSLHWGLCVPSSCSAQDLKGFLSAHLRTLGIPLRVSVELEENMCHTNTPLTLDKWDMIFLCFLVLYGTVIVFATFYSLALKKSEKASSWEQTLVAFSVTDNLKKLVSYSPTELHLDCIYGLKTLSMVFIIFGHSLLFLLGGPVLNEADANKEVGEILNQPFSNNQLFVDTFLFVSGFLLCRLMMDEMKKKKGKSVNLAVLFIVRYVRLTPAYAVVIAFYATLFYKMDSGPLWDARIGAERDRCIQSWWLNLLYINNYVNVDSLCMFQSWYVAADTHLFTISIVVIYLLWHKPTLGKLVLFILTMFSLIIPFIVTLVSRLDPLIMVFRSEIVDISTNSYFKNAYIKTHMKATAYLCGVILGYIVHRFQNSNLKVSKTVSCCGWIFSAILLISSLYSSAVFYDTNYRYYAMDAAVFSSLDRFGWCIGCSWVIFACVTKNAENVNKFLSWRVWVPFSRLSYTAFLVNGIVILHSLGTLRSPVLIHKLNFMNILASRLLWTYSIALGLCITFESPLNSLQKILLNSVTKKKEVTGDRETIKKNSSEL